MSIQVPGLYINAKTKEFAVFQNKRTSQYVIDVHSERLKMLSSGFEFMCGITGDACINVYGLENWKQVKRGMWTKPEDTKADALAYAEAVVAILKSELKEKD